MKQISARLGHAAIGLSILASLGCLGGVGRKADDSRPFTISLTPDVVRQGSTTPFTVRTELTGNYFFNSSSIALNTALGTRSGSSAGVTESLTVPASVGAGLYSLTVRTDQSDGTATSRLFVVPAGSNHKLSFPAEVLLNTDNTANLGSILSSPLVSKLEAIGLPPGITMSADNGYDAAPFNRQETTGISSSKVRFTGTVTNGTYPFKLRWSTSSSVIEEVNTALQVSSATNNSIRIFDQNGGAELASPWTFTSANISFPIAAGYPFNMRIAQGSRILTIRSTSALTAGTYATPYEGLEVILISSDRTYVSSYGTVVVNSVSPGRVDMSIPAISMVGESAEFGNFSFDGRIVK